jgi:hypothetical protein
MGPYPPPGLGRERNSPRSGKSEAEAGEHRQVGVKRDLLFAHVAETSRRGIESANTYERPTCPGSGSSSSSLLCWPSLATLAGDASPGSRSPRTQ